MVHRSPEDLYLGLTIFQIRCRQRANLTLETGEDTRQVSRGGFVNIGPFPSSTGALVSTSQLFTLTIFALFARCGRF